MFPQVAAVRVAQRCDAATGCRQGVMDRPFSGGPDRGVYRCWSLRLFVKACVRSSRGLNLGFPRIRPGVDYRRKMPAKCRDIQTARLHGFDRIQ